VEEMREEDPGASFCIKMNDLIFTICLWTTINFQFGWGTITSPK